MEYKVIREDEFGVLVVEKMSMCCTKCKYKNKHCSRIDNLKCIGEPIGSNGITSVDYPPKQSDLETYKTELVNRLNEMIENSNKQATEFFKQKMQFSEMGSSSMAIAYQTVKELILKS